MTDVLTVDFEYSGQHAIIKLYSKFTVVSGDSGEGKSEFIFRYNQEEEQGNCHVTCSAGYDVFLIPDSETKYNFDKIAERCVFVIDEISMRKTLNIRTLRKSHHIFICITRANTICGNNSLKGSYILKRLGDWYEFQQCTLPMYKDGEDVDVIITEAATSRSENELISAYTDNVVAASGRDNIEDKLFSISGRALVLMDLGNIGNSYYLIHKRCSDNKNIRIYDYMAFEELLYKSPIVSALPEVVLPSIFDAPSIERYFEKVLEIRTYGTELAYVHGKPLATPYLRHVNFEAIFNSNVGRPLMHLLQKMREKDLDHFDAESYMRSLLGDKINNLPEPAINECHSKEDCDNLIDSLRNVLEL